MRRAWSLFLIGCCAWAQQPTPKTPQNADVALTSSSFSASGLRNERILTDFFTGNFGDIPFNRENVAFAGLFQEYLQSYGRHCDRYLPSNKVELTQTVCAREDVRIDRFGSRIGTGTCAVYRTEGMGIYADPALHAAKTKLDDEAGLSMIKDAFQMMQQPNALGTALSALGEARSMADDMNAIFQLNSCTSPGVKRLQENIVRFSQGMQAIVLPGTVTSAVLGPPPSSTGPFKDQNYSKLLEDLILDQSRTWLMNRFVPGSTSSVVVSSRDSAGRPTKLSGRYLFNGRSQGSVTLTFSEGVPQCMYFFDLPSTCKTPSRTIATAYSGGGYSQLEPAAANPVPSAAAAQPIEPAAQPEAPAKAAPAAAPARVVPPSTPSVPVPTAQEQRAQQFAEAQRQMEKARACQTALQQGLKDRPSANAELMKEYSSCVQAAVQPAKARGQ